MRIELNLRPDRTYHEDFFSDFGGGRTPEGDYSFDSSSGILKYGYNTYHRATVNGLELLIRDDSWNDWKEKKTIYVALIKISDDPSSKTGHLEENDPILRRLFSNGVYKKQNQQDATANTPTNQKANPKDSFDRASASKLSVVGRSLVLRVVALRHCRV